MLYYSILSYFYAFAMWFIFFQVPKNYGMLNKFHKVDKTDIDALSLRSSMVGAEDNLKTMVREMSQDEKFHKTMKRKSQIINGSTLMSTMEIREQARENSAKQY